MIGGEPAEAGRPRKGGRLRWPPLSSAFSALNVPPSQSFRGPVRGPRSQGRVGLRQRALPATAVGLDALARPTIALGAAPIAIRCGFAFAAFGTHNQHPVFELRGEFCGVDVSWQLQLAAPVTPRSLLANEIAFDLKRNSLHCQAEYAGLQRHLDIVLRNGVNPPQLSPICRVGYGLDRHTHLIEDSFSEPLPGA